MVFQIRARQMHCENWEKSSKLVKKSKNLKILAFTEPVNNIFAPIYFDMVHCAPPLK